MKKLIRFIMLCILSLSFLGMGTKQESQIPIPAKSFSATVIDRAQVKTTGNNISVEGKTFFKSKHGKGCLFLEFQEIKKVTFLEPQKKEIPVEVLLKNGEKLTGLVNGNVFFYGEATFGKFKIKVREILTIEFLEQSP